MTVNYDNLTSKNKKDRRNYLNSGTNAKSQALWQFTPPPLQPKIAIELAFSTHTTN